MIKAVVFDLGGVLSDSSPRYLYRKLLKSEAEIDEFLSTVCTPAWNHQQDLGRSWQEGTDELIEKFPDKKDLILAYWHRWEDTINGPFHQSVDILMDLKRRGIPLYLLSNYSPENFPKALELFPFLRLFDGRIVSGFVKLAKPDPAIYHLLLNTYHLNPRETLFIDDKRENVQAAWDVGMNAVQFLSPAQLEQDLIEYGLITGPDLEADHSHHCGSDADHSHSCCGGGKCH